jgi:signal transduction histidine kinase
LPWVGKRTVRMLLSRQIIVKSAMDVVLALGIIAIFASDEILQPRLEVPVVYIVPVALASLSWRVRTVLIVVAATLLVIFVDSLRRAESTAEFGMYLDCVLIVAFVAILLTLERERAREEARHRQQLTQDVERLRQPLTVILGYAQLMRPNRHPSTASSERASATIYRCAQEMRRILREILPDSGPRPT